MIETNKFEFEICANSVESCIAAQQAGADRVELCMGIPEGGTTPSYGEIQMARDLLRETKLHVIIRNRGGDFLYTQRELERMAMDIDLCRKIGVDGVVFGCLTAEGDVDNGANRFLLEHATGMNTTFHRAFDRCKEPLKNIESVISLGFNRVLTSGQQATAEMGIPLLHQLNNVVGDRIIIMAGCGVNENNIKKIQTETGVRAFHFSAREPKKSQMKYSNPSVFMGNADFDEDTIFETTINRVRKTIHALRD